MDISVSRRRGLHEHRREHRNRHQARSHRSRSRQRERQRTRAAVILNVDDDAENQENEISGCIDLTEVADEEFIDLTSPSSSQPTGVNDASVIVLSSNRESRRRNRRHRHRYTEIVDDSPTRDPDIQDAVIEIPALPSFSDDEETGTSTANRTTDINDSIASPLSREITCPICMDNKKQIQRSGRQLCSTTCGHIFCKPCIQAAINAQRCCPTCRKKLSTRQIHPIFI